VDFTAWSIPLNSTNVSLPDANRPILIVSGGTAFSFAVSNSQTMKPRTLIFGLALALWMPGAFAQSMPVDRAEILGRLAQGYPASYIAHLVKTRGVNFSPAGDFLYRVELAGGAGILIERLSSSDASGQPHALSDPEASYEHLGKCAELIHIGDVRSVEKECRAAIDENPKSPWPLLTEAEVLGQYPLPGSSEEFSKEREQKRAEFIRRAAALAPNLASAHRAVGSILSMSDHKIEAIAESQQALTLDPEGLEASEQGYGNITYGERGSFGLTASLFSYVPRQDDGSELARSPYEFLTATPEMTRRMKIEPDLVTSHLALAIRHSQAGNFEKAQSEFREAIRLEPGNAQLHIGFGLFYLSRNNAEECIAEMREGVRIAPFAALPRLALAGALETLGKTPQAITELQNLLALDPNALEPSSVLIELYLEHKDRKSAIGELRRSLKASSVATADQAKFVEARFEDLHQLARLLQEDRDFTAAAEEYLYMLRYQPDSSALHNDYGNVLLAQRRLDEALAEYNEALRFAPKMSTAHHNIGICLALQKNLEGAISEFRQALELNPNEPRSQAFLATALVYKGDTREGLEQFRQAIERNPQDAEAHTGLGFALERLKDIPGAIKEFKVALELKADSPDAENNLAWIYATADDPKLRNPAEALVLARRAVASSPQPNPAFIDTLAEALLLNGHPAEALTTELQAIRLDPKNAELQSRLARFREAVELRSSAKP